MFEPFISSDDLMAESYNYKFFKRSNHFLACVAHSIKTQATFDDVKNCCKSILAKNNGYIRINKWNDVDLDIATAGWLFESHPTIHHRDHIHKIIQTYCTSSNQPYYPIELQTKTITFTNRNTKIKTSTHAIHILCRHGDITKVQHMLQTMYSDDNFHGPGKFVPINIAAKQNTFTLEKLITLQKSYIDHHRSITVLGVSSESLYQLVDNNNNDTLSDLAKKCVWINWLTPTTKTDTHGRIIFSTTSQNYFSAIDWIETTFLPLHKNIRHRMDPPEFDGNAYRLVRKGQSNTVSDDYSKSLMNTIQSISIPTTSTNNAWPKRSYCIYHD